MLTAELREKKLNITGELRGVGYVVVARSYANLSLETPRTPGLARWFCAGAHALFEGL